MIDYDDFLSEVLPDVPGVPHFTAIDAIRNSCIQLAEQSLILRKTLSAINVVAETTDYPVAAGTSLRTITALRVEFDESVVHPLQEETRLSMTATTQDLPYRYSLEGPELLHLEWTPSASIAGGLVVRIAYKPHPSSTACDDILWEDWHEFIAAGALARLQSNPDKRWTSTTSAKRNQLIFVAGINKAWSRAHKSHTKSDTRVRFTPMSGGSRRGHFSF